jgi:GMP synthase PP-ATPase subunit
LGVRILGEITGEKLAILQEADFIYIDELKKRGLYDNIWQVFSVLLHLRSVGVSGDMRRPWMAKWSIFCHPWQNRHTPHPVGHRGNAGMREY